MKVPLFLCVQANGQQKIGFARQQLRITLLRNERFDSRHSSSPGRLRWTGPETAATNPGPAVLGHLLWRFSDVFLEPLAVIPWQSLYQPWGFWRHGRPASL